MSSHIPISYARTPATRAEFARSDAFKDLSQAKPRPGQETFSCTSRHRPTVNMDYVRQSHNLADADSGTESSNQLPRLNLSNKRRGSDSTNAAPLEIAEPDFAPFNETFHERRRSISAASVTSSPWSSPSTTPSDDTSCSEMPWKRQREDSSDQLISIRLPPALRSGYPKSKCHLVAEINLSIELEALKHRFLTHEMSSKALLGGPSLLDNQPCSQSFATSGKVYLCGDDRVRLTDRPLEKNTFSSQCSSSNFVTAPVTHPASFQSSTLRGSSSIISTGRSECAYTSTAHGDHPFVPQGTHSHSLHMKSHRQYSTSKIQPHAPPRTDAEAYRHPCHTSLTNGNDRSRGSLMDRHLNVDHPLTSPMLQKIAPEEPIFQTIHSKSTHSLDPIYSTTAESTLLAKEPRTNHSGLPSRHEFTAAIDTYLSALSLKKRPKALVTQQLYEDIIFNLKCEKDSLPGTGTPQFRFWCRKHFILQTIPRLRLREQADIPHSVIALPIGNQDIGDPGGEVEVVTHDGQPVVTRESIYDVLAKCHTLSNHAGRDKTTAIVKQNYSWVPKVLIGDFIKLCPVCCSKKVAGVTWTHSYSKPDLTPLV